MSILLLSGMEAHSALRAPNSAMRSHQDQMNNSANRHVTSKHVASNIVSQSLQATYHPSTRNFYTDTYRQ